MNNFEKHEKEIREYIDNEIIAMFPRLISYHIHILPEFMVQNTEFIFKVHPDLNEDQILGLWDDIDSKLFGCYRQLGLEFDFITVLSKI